MTLEQTLEKFFLWRDRALMVSHNDSTGYDDGWPRGQAKPGADTKDPETPHMKGYGQPCFDAAYPEIEERLQFYLSALRNDFGFSLQVADARIGCMQAIVEIISRVSYPNIGTTLDIAKTALISLKRCSSTWQSIVEDKLDEQDPQILKVYRIGATKEAAPLEGLGFTMEKDEEGLYLHSPDRLYAEALNWYESWKRKKSSPRRLKNLQSS